MKKQRIFLAAVLVCCLALAGGGTLAFFTARETAYNVITTGELAMNLVETHDGAPWPEEGVSGVMPGETIEKIVTVQNVGGVDFYARVKVTGQIQLEGKDELIEMKPEHVELVGLNSTEWTKQGEYYYYHRALAPRGADGVIDETEPLFTAVKLKEGLDNAYQNAKLTVFVDAQAVQSRNNGASALEAAGWNE